MSQSSLASTIPYEELTYLHPDIIPELEIITELYPYFTDDSGTGEFYDEDERRDDDDDDDDDDDGNDVVGGSSASNDNACDTHFDSETYKQDQFRTKSCGCKSIHDGRPCTEVVVWEELINYRLCSLERSKDELDMLIKVQLFHQHNMDSKTDRNKDRVRPRQVYYFAGKRVCRELFAFAHGIHRQTVDSIAKSLDQVGFEPRRHGNTGNIPAKSITLSDVTHLKTFIINYASQYGLPLPGRLANYRQEKAKLLPSDKTKYDIYKLYCEASVSEGHRVISFSAFKKVWLEQCPNILIMRPSTDLCLKCQKYVTTISNGASLTEEEKQDLTAKYSDHIGHVKMQRDHYRILCQQSGETFSKMQPELKIRGQLPCIQDVTMHYSFDYAQQVFNPHYAQQVGPLFFKTPRKCQCFGVACEASGSQVFYLIDEAMTSVGKGANSVSSLLHDHFKYSYGESNVELHMDNCSGQNKNNTVLGYGMWRIMNGHHRNIQFNMMEAGHTKFSPDWHFGLWKVRWKRSNAETIQDVADTVTQSSKTGLNISKVVGEDVPFYNWSKFCKANFKVIPGLTKYHHFRMTSQFPGSVFVKKYALDAEVEVKILKKNCNVVGVLPEQILPEGLDVQRQWYLYEQIAPLCHNSEFACPKPLLPKPKKIKID